MNHHAVDHLLVSHSPWLVGLSLATAAFGSWQARQATYSKLPRLRHSALSISRVRNKIFPHRPHFAIRRDVQCWTANDIG